MPPPPGMQVFRITLNPKPKTDADNVASADVGRYRARRTHKKSRGGCLACKQKRKKCDEVRPKCSACIKKDCDCRWPERSHHEQCEASKALAPLSASRDCRLSFRTPMVLLDEGQHTEHDLFLLDHFIKMTTPQFENKKVADVYTTRALDLAKEKPYLMHAAIAQAACHFNQIKPDEPRYRLAEAYHIQLASRGLRDAVAVINGLKDSDAILTTAMLVNGITFCAAEYRDEKREPQWWWLRIQIGLTDLLIRTSPYHPESMWRFMFAASNEFEILEPASNDLGVKLAAFCGITEASTEENCIYFEPIQWLNPIITRPPNKCYMLLYLRFIGSITSDFVDLLQTRDIKALLIFANWLALMCSINEWWSVRRTTRECWKICDYLIKVMDPEDLHLLELPAKACGYL